MQGLNESRIVDRIVESLADLQNRPFENAFGHEGIGPDGIQKFLFRDQPALTVGKIMKHRERLRR